MDCNLRNALFAEFDIQTADEYFAKNPAHREMHI